MAIMKERFNLARSIDTVLSLNGVALGGQQNATLQRRAEMINITNRINDDWSQSLAGTKGWSVDCSGLYVINDKAFKSLETCFMTNTPIEISMTIGASVFKGRAYITDFPLTATFNKEFMYSLKLLGTGALQEE